MILFSLPFLPWVWPAVWWFETVKAWGLTPVHDVRDRYHVDGNVIRLRRGL